MSGYILCQGKRAAQPYYIENISTNIYSMEELCFYLYHNMYLLDETILNEELCFWIRDQLERKRLAQRLYELLDGGHKVGEFILPIFKEINYLSMEEFRKFNVQLARLEEEPPILRRKHKGDYLMDHEKYVNAIRVYRAALQEKAGGAKTDRTGAQTVGGIWHNMGCAYARLFQMEEAVRCFGRAYESLRTEDSIRSYLCAVFLEGGGEAMEEKAVKLGLAGEQTEEVRRRIREASEDIYATEAGQTFLAARAARDEGDAAAYDRKTGQWLAGLTRAYHRSTGY